MVSVCCLTYNHAKYICQCLDGILMQVTNFKYEVLIHDDCSTDGTADIIRDYERKYPDILKPIIEEENQLQNGKPSGSVVWNYPRAEGKYVAICEGDDYWIDPFKLQKQVDFLEGNNQYGLCYTQCRYYFEATQTFEKIAFGGPGESIDSLLKANTVPSLTVLMNRDLLIQYIEEVNPLKRKWKMGDYPIWLWFAQNSRIKFIDQVSGIYRMLPKSACHFDNAEKKIQFQKSSFDVKRYFINKYKWNYSLKTLTREEVSAKLKVYAVYGEFYNFLKLWITSIRQDFLNLFRTANYTYLVFFICPRIRDRRK